MDVTVSIYCYGVYSCRRLKLSGVKGKVNLICGHTYSYPQSCKLVFNTLTKNFKNFSCFFAGQYTEILGSDSTQMAIFVVEHSVQNIQIR